MRVVVDSALRNCNTGPSINQAFCKGPATLNSIFNVLTRWRSYEKAMVYDLKKAYHSIKTTKKEFFTRLCVWKFKDDDPWMTFGHTVIGMGDQPATTFLELTKGVAAEKGRHIDEHAADQLVKNSYVDDTVA